MSGRRYPGDARHAGGVRDEDASDERTRVVLVNHTDQLRPEVEKLTKALPAGEFAVSVVLPEAAAPQVEPRDGVAYRFYDAVFVPNIRYTLPLPSFFGALWRELPRADVVHVIGYSYLTSAAATLAASRAGVPAVVTVDAMRGVSWSYGNRLVDAVASAYTWLLGRRVLSAADHVVGLGEYLRADFERFVDDAASVEIIPNGVDVEHYSPRKLTADGSASDGDEDVVRLVYVGRLDTVKGVPYLLEAFADLRADGDREYELTIVGDGSRRDAYERLCRRLGVEDAVSFEGYQRDVRRYYAESDVFVLPSVSEGLPTVTMEAQASGVPVVSTDVGGARELVRGGRVVPRKDPAALRDAVADLAASDLDERGARARRHVREHYSLDRMSDAYADLYRRAAAGE